MGLAGVIALLAACGGGASSDRNTPSEAPSRDHQVPENVEQSQSTMVNRIAYVTDDGNIATINPDGSDPRRLTRSELRVGGAGPILAQAADNQTFYTWPTWSPDGTRLAASRVNLREDSAQLALEIIDASSGVSKRVYENEPSTIQVAQGAPHYMYWSPDSSYLAFLATTRRHLSLFLAPSLGESASAQIAVGSPIYYSWAREPGALLIRRQNDLLHLPGPQVGSEMPSPVPLDFAGSGFRVPALSHDGRTVYYTGSWDGSNALYAAALDDAEVRPRYLADVGRLAAFMLSPTGEELAVADTDQPGSGQYDRLFLIGTGGGAPRILADEGLLAFFWSPDGRKLIYVVFDPERRSFAWKLADRDEGPPVVVAEFLPSADLLTALTFFDQYALSHSIWSPDSRHIVFTGELQRHSSGTNGGSPQGPKVYVLEAKEGAVPQEVASGRIAFWSWN
ncbi:MAG: PD40 domain-containing protein [Dehalococcoidia bacterium]|nr:PD40 domain-containing protein [Dehalococcoidia bacterium]